MGTSCLSFRFAATKTILILLQMARSRRNLNDSRPQSPSDEDSPDEHDNRSPQEPPRGRTGKQDKSTNKDVDIAA